jgi:spore maturation protein CgeB
MSIDLGCRSAGNMIKNLRVLVFDTYYPAFLAAHYDARPGIESRPYDEQLRALLARRFGTSDAYSHHLQGLGHEAAEIIANCEPLQVAWAREHGGSSSFVRGLRKVPGPGGTIGRRLLLREIALAQIEEFDPDVIYLQDLLIFDRRTLAALRRQGRLVVGQIASPLPPESQLRAFDLLTSALPAFVAHFRRLSIDSEYVGIAFDERVLDDLDGSGEPEESEDVTFVGGLNPALYSTGTRVLERAAAELPLAVWGHGGEDLPPGSAILRRYRGEAWGMDMYRVLARSRITLNRHGEIAGGQAANMRLFEATGVGTMLVTEAAPNLHDLFEPDREVVAYEGEQDLIEKLRYYLDHEEERRRIAAAGQGRTLREHTYEQRIAELAVLLQDRLTRARR